MKEKEIALRMSVMMTGRVKTERMTCEEVVSMGRYPYTGKMGILTEKDWQIVRESLELVQGLELAEKDFEAVSDGQRQRVLLARAICQEPQVIVLDEPTAFLDIRHKLELLYLLKNMVREKKVAVPLPPDSPCRFPTGYLLQREFPLFAAAYTPGSLFHFRQ